MNTEKAPVDWPVQQIAAQAGTTCRTLRHHHTIGLLTPSRTASNGYLHYNQAALVRLQRILLLRELGLGLPAIAAVLSAETSVPDALRRHVAWWGLDTTQKQAWKDSVASLNNDWITASTSGVTPDSPQAQELARRYVQWLRSIPGTLATAPGGDVRSYVLGLAEMYVADGRFGANYGRAGGAGLVRGALVIFAERGL